MVLYIQFRVNGFIDMQRQSVFDRPYAEGVVAT